MKNRLLKFIAVVGLILIFIIGCTAMGIKGASMVLVLPFNLIGKGLRILSLSGRIGNIVAIILYVLVCLVPLVPCVRGKRKPEEIFLLLCSIMMFYIVYCMINPGFKSSNLMGTTGDIIMSGCVYSLLFAWAVIKLLRGCDSMNSVGVYRALRVFLWICIIDCVVCIIAEYCDKLAVLNQVMSTNTAQVVSLESTYVFIFMSFAVIALEYGLVIFVIFLAIGLICELEADSYSEKCCIACENTAKWCRRTLIVVIMANVVFNLAQVIFAPVLVIVDVTFRLPFFNIAVAFALLALSKLLNKGRQIKQDNELFV